MLHELKIYKKYADAIVSGEKTFELRFNDRNYQVGDTVRFTVFDDSVKPVEHPLSDKTYRITYVLDNNNFMLSGLVQGWCVFSIKEVSNGNSET